MRKLIDSSMLGKYLDPDGYTRYEYQIGRRLVWLRCPAGHEEEEYLQGAEEFHQRIWLAIPDVLAVAEAYSRSLIPEFWALHDRGQRDGFRLDVWGTTITPSEGVACFTCSRNHDFDFDSLTSAKDHWRHEPFHLPDLPEGHFVFVYRDSSGRLSASATE